MPQFTASLFCLFFGRLSIVSAKSCRGGYHPPVKFGLISRAIRESPLRLCFHCAGDDLCVVPLQISQFCSGSKPPPYARKYIAIKIKHRPCIGFSLRRSCHEVTDEVVAKQRIRICIVGRGLAPAAQHNKIRFTAS